ncbi:MAG TPA: hypothetical protein PLT91_05345 [Clostridia bacterium]|jgi:protein-tyrosine phosphatase|nr:MAG: Tyrosine-protein phosphatase CpsB [Firmicutes bacterium ADurb.Bin146]HOD93030.1 hypothetical protein [Clostridia bacterium]HQM39645.1 hypothetical protein [Clostridia bacterium]
MIDIHCHILPKADHGSYSLEDSLKQLKTAHKYGIKSIICTPHFYPFNDSIDKFLTRRDKAYDELSAVNDTEIKLYKGAEVRLVTGLSKQKKIKKLAFENSNYILIEMPSSIWNNMLLNEIANLQSIGLTVIIAHIERYSFRQVQKLMALDVLGQINAYSLYSPVQAWRIRKYIRKSMVDFIASDTHIYNYFLTFRFLKKSRFILGSSYTKFMDNAAKLIV